MNPTPNRTTPSIRPRRRAAARSCRLLPNKTRLLEVLQLQIVGGLCPECFHSGRAISVAAATRGVSIR
jgi:hypothetical protein